MTQKNNQRPLLVAIDTVLFPFFTNTFEIGKAESMNAIKNATEKHNGEILIANFFDNQSSSSVENILTIATLGKIENVTEKEDHLLVKIKGINRVSLKSVTFTGNFNAVFEQVKDKEIHSKEAKALKAEILEHLETGIKNLNIPLSLNEIKNFEGINPGIFSFSLSSLIPFPFEIKRLLLEEDVVAKRLKVISKTMINTEEIINVKTVSGSINDRVKDKMSKQQREYYLKEQLKAIQEELGEISGDGNEIEQLTSRVMKNPYPKHIKEKLLKEIKKLEATPSQAAEANIIRSYIETLIDLPYWQVAKDNSNIVDALKILDENHFGLEKPKQKIIEFLAVKQNNPDSKGAILSLVGPPGTGKTTLAKSIANALNKPFVKISLGGVKDEAEIRGHRRTYIAAMPGKIINAMKKAGVINPLILLDEIDKMSSDYKGDPTSAMLEVLDYEQNAHFEDHYLEEEYDLSNVTFIATANYFKQIPEALYDRLDIVEISSYTEIEKIEIAKKHLIPAILKDTMISPKLFKWNDEAIKFVIQKYTMEAGVRQLRRVIDEVSRKILVLKLNHKVKNNLSLNPKKIEELIGKPKFEFTKKDDVPQIGTVIGLAWTQYGGDILPIEVSTYPGDGKLVITGQLKDVMTESATIALSYVKANAGIFGIPEKTNGKDTFKNIDIHVHSPDGSTPKDGPSAGVTFTTALISALSGRPVSNTLGMTGEITLRGKVFPIGGLKEKSISANRSGLKKIFIPEDNIKDLDEIPKEVRENLEIKAFKDYKDIYNEIFVMPNK
ncbi:MAG: endopeptidase La [Mycoplasmataceae bacterium]|nr:endopeptidase La [Mycoplasmataceae bacterium]